MAFAFCFMWTQPRISISDDIDSLNRTAQTVNHKVKMLINKKPFLGENKKEDLISVVLINLFIQGFVLNAFSPFKLIHSQYCLLHSSITL